MINLYDFITKIELIIIILNKQLHGTNWDKPNGWAMTNEESHCAWVWCHIHLVLTHETNEWGDTGMMMGWWINESGTIPIAMTIDGREEGGRNEGRNKGGKEGWEGFIEH